ncbi:MAG: hypothetical protein V4532_10275, partial [Pseudomonadota bacterium]
EKAVAEPNSAALLDASTALAIHFAEKEGPASDVSGVSKTAAAIERDPNGLMGSAAKLTGQALVWSAPEKARAPA